jgi:chromosome segregation ATPase
MDADEVRDNFSRINRHLAQADQHFAQIDERFVQVDQRFAQIDQRFDQVDQRFDQVDRRFDQVDQRFHQMDQHFHQMDQRFHQMDQKFAQVDAQFVEMRQLILSEGERTRKHFDVVAEAMQDRIALIGEGYAALKIDTIEIKDRLDRVEGGLDRLDVRVLAVESRTTNIEKTQKIVLTEVRGLATTVERPLKPRQRRP